MNVKELRDNHALLSRKILAVIYDCEFLGAGRWADPRGVADIEAASLMQEAADIMADCWHGESKMKILEKGDIFSERRSDEQFVVLGLMGTTARILDLADFDERMITIDRKREYVVWGHIEEE